MRTISTLAVSAGVALGAFLAPGTAAAQNCSSPDPTQWPAPSKPYFMLVVDTSGSMGTAVPTGTNSCGYQHNRIGDARCAVKKTIDAFSGEVNFGLATYAWQLSCPSNAGTCANCTQNTGCFPNTNCTANYSLTDDSFCGPLTNDSALNGSLNNSFPNTTQLHAGGYVQVPLTQDNYWNPPLNPSNFPTIFGLVDNNCGNGEIGADSNTPLGGVLFNMNQYFAGTYADPFTGTTLPTPIGPSTFGGKAAERPCRSINVILLTDGDESCDAYNDGVYPGFEGLAVFEAGRLLSPGVTVSGQTFGIKTYVIGFIGATTTSLDHIASAGGTTASYVATNETTLSQALASIVGGAIKPESCNNVDDNCNGCVDEGFQHYCDVPANISTCCQWKTPAAKTTCGASACACCNWTTAAERTTCLTNYTNSITSANPKGDQTLLPCTTVTQSQASATWLCYDPGDTCDNVDNNCNGTVDENQLKCGSPLHCPTAETCNGQDDDCNGIVDDKPGGGSVCTNTCLVNPSAETCNGCDDDCDGVIDNGVSVSIPCGPPPGPTEPAYCQGTITCKPPQPAPSKGACIAGAGFTTCTYSTTPPAETCDGIDNDCNGLVDDNIPSVACVPAGTPAGLVYGGTSQCKKGTTQCVNGATVCVGFVGPSAEICDGLDNNCDGTVDNGVPGVGQACGKNQPPCTAGVTACQNGVLTCTGGVGPQPEICDGIDNDCNGQIDDGALADEPPSSGCWDLPGTCCSYHDPKTNKTTSWCPPPGATCNDVGTLAMPACSHGVLLCQAGGWVCKGSKDPSPEVCDGLDNDCDGTVDNGVMNVGTACGSNVGECKPGVLQCNGGVLSCVGGMGPTQEICDGKDNDCDGTIDNGIPTGGACTVPYDTTLYPGSRTGLPCKPGIYQCDGMGNLVCVGGVGPQPEVCDGIDNDCDGMIDEVGSPPDGINGTDNPFPPPGGKIGDPCGTNMATCTQGNYACLNGQFACIGGTGPQPETCDCQDNDCDGQVDNQTPNGPPICGSGKDCVKSSFGCQCAEQCDKTKEFPCPGGQICQEVTNSNSGMPAGAYCVSDPCGGDCTGKTVTDANNKVICAPPGTAADPSTCVAPPVCACHGQDGCKDPCFGVSCQAGTVCAEYGSNAGKCVVDNCFANPCQGCGKVCNLGSCVANPCTPDPCAADEECQPTPDFTGHTCVKSCGGVTCPSGQACVMGACAPTCNPPCASGQACDTTQSPPACVMDKCSGMNPCTDGSFCNPVTGSCGNDPCAGVVCPMGQECQNGSCYTKSGTTGAGGSSTTSTTAGSTSSGSTGTGTGGSGGGGIWGLATGGGGCSVSETGAGRFADARLLLAALAMLVARRRRRAREERRTQKGEVVS